MHLSRLSVVVPALLLARVALAQGSPLPQFNLDQLDVNTAALGSMVVGTGDTLPAGSLRFSLAGDYENDPLVYYTADGTLAGSVISDRFTVHVVGAWAPTDWIQFGVDLPVIASQTGVDLREYGIPIPTRRAIQSPTATVRVRLTNQANGALLDSALQVGIRPPIGTDGAWAKERAIGVAPKLMLGRHFGWLLAGGELGVRWSPSGSTLPAGGDLPNTLGNHFQLAGVLSAGDATGLRGEASARTTVSFEGRGGPVELLGGLRYNFGLMELFALAGPSLGATGTGSPEFRVMTGLAFGNAAGLTGVQPGTAPAVAPPSTGGRTR
jgi:hypothetical protein